MPSHETQIIELPNGNKVAYIDSGSPADSDDFATLVLLHGASFNAYNFEHLLPLAPKMNLRLILLQRRDYSGSSKYTDEEMGDLVANPNTYLHKTGVLMAHFCHYLIKNTRVCKPNADRSWGGISISGWSLGAIHAMSMFTEELKLDTVLYGAVEPYISTLIFYDPPYIAFGISNPEVIPHFLPFTRPSETLEQQNAAFMKWVGGYFDHPSTWTGDISKLDGREATEKCTFSTWSTVQQGKYTEAFPLRSDGILISHPVVQSKIKDMSAAVVFGVNSPTRPFPNTRVSYLHGMRTTWNSVMARHEIDNKVSELALKGQAVRGIHFKDVEYGNHFMHIDYPEEFMKTMAECIRQDKSNS